MLMGIKDIITGTEYPLKNNKDQQETYLYEYIVIDG